MSYDDQAANKAFAEKYNFNFPLLCDTDRTMGAAYGAGTSGTAKRIGVIIGPDGKVIEYEPKAVPKEFPHQALAKL